MYPKVIVRTEELDEDYGRPLSPLRDFNCLSIRDVGAPGKENEKSSSLSMAKIPRVYIQSPITPPPSSCKFAQLTDKKKNEQDAEDCGKPHIRASSVPRPRAVISSPDNDQIFGGKSSTRMGRSPALKRFNMPQSKHSAPTRHSEGRCTPIITGRKPLKRESESREIIRTSDHAKGKKDSTLDVRVPRANIAKAKPCFTTT